MTYPIQFLTQYRGDTRQTTKIVDRFGWATAEIDLDRFTSQGFRPVLRKSGDAGPADHVYHDGVHFWVEANSTNTSCRGESGSLGGFEKYWWGGHVEGLKNFQPREQQRFAWNTFGFRMFDRLPVSHFYTLWPNKLKNYRPGKTVQWDETAVIEKRYAGYLRENLCILEDVVMCRIERPCFIEKQEKWRDTKVFTPIGGFGDPVLNYETVENATRDEKFMRAANWEWLISQDELAEIDERGLDPLARSVRAVFMDLFRQKSWLGEQKKITKSKAAKKVAALHEIWKSRGASVDDGHLDEVVGILVSIAEEGPVRDILDAWENRVISF